ncbi:unnamed protein product [Blepharisma stoltei]|uniref:RING-type domain-containing protein n=1 Tax=Blepharisma stoltei TaxID=1481888 RepID=A0AAU9KEV2_9CILI|nr:unnamed protein product [Blepharisma stoltei]
MQDPNYLLRWGGLSKKQRKSSRLSNTAYFGSEIKPKHTNPRPREKKFVKIPDYVHQYNLFKKENSPKPKLAFRSNFTDITLSPLYQFSLLPSAHFSIYHENPNIPIPWDSIRKVTYLTTNEIRCPVCLNEDFIAPKINKCGHIFCWPCVIRFLRASGKDAKKCPICQDAVKGDLLRTAEVKLVKNIKEGDIVKMKLIKREKNKISVFPCDENSESRALCGFFDEKSRISKFSHIKVYFDQLNDLKNQQIQLSKALGNSTEESEVNAINRAQEILIKELGKMNTIKEPKPNTECNCQISYHPIYLYSIPCEKHPQSDYLPSFPSTNIEETKEETEYLYFYQISDSQPYYLHPLDEKILLSQYGTYEAFPNPLRGKVLEIEQLAEVNFPQSLKHIPQGSSIYFIEMNLEEVCSEETLNKFKSEINIRQKNREAAKLREEELQQIIVRRNQANEEANRLLDAYFQNPTIAVPVEKNQIEERDEEEEEIQNFEENSESEEEDFDEPRKITLFDLIRLKKK